MLLGFIAFTGAAHLLIRSSVHGLLLTWDSMAYLSTAENLAAGKGLRNYSYDFFEAWWPLFYPLILAFLNLIVDNIFEVSRFVNVVALGLIILLAGHWLSQYIRSSLLVICAAAMVTISHVMTQIASYAMTDTLFVLLTLLTLINIGLFLKNTPNRFQIGSLILSGFFASLAPVTRYIGVTVILTAAILILIDQKFPFSKRLKYATIYTFTSSMPFVVLLGMNKIVTGDYFGRRWAARYSLYDYLIEVRNMLIGIGETLPVLFYASEPTETWLYSNYILLMEAPNWVSYYLFLVVIFLIIFVSLLMLKIYLDHKDRPKLIAEIADKVRILLPVIVFILVYVISLSLILSRSRDWFNKDYRHLSPIYIPILILIMFFLDQLLRLRIQGLLMYVFRLFAGFLIVFSFIIHTNRAVQWNIGTTVIATRVHGQYVYEYSRNSPIIDYLNANPIKGEIFNNAGMNVLYQLTNIPAPVRYLPKGDVKSCLEWISLRSADSSTPTYIVYLIRDHLISDYCDPRELASQSQHLEMVIEKHDGVVYKIVP